MLICADARHIPLADESVQMVCTSPPYWGLRKYAGSQDLIWSTGKSCTHEWAEETKTADLRTGNGLKKLSKQYRGGGKKNGKIGQFIVHSGTCKRCGAWRGAFGLEPTMEMYVEHTIKILREIRRVLREDGVVFWNLGDSYHNGDKGGHPRSTTGKQTTNRGTVKGLTPNRLWQANLKPKDLVLMPARIALAAQADGWWVRSDIIWAKPNPMPESVQDRPTDSYEHILMLTKSKHYFWDADAVRENSTDPGRANWENHNRRDKELAEARSPDSSPHTLAKLDYRDAGRNLRNVWMFATQPYTGAHFATFPEELPRRCILAATSSKGACLQCGAPWERVVRITGGTTGKSWHDHQADMEQGKQQADGAEIRQGYQTSYHRQTIGWRPACTCPGQRDKTRPCIILDPFAGSGTTGRVAVELKRTPILIDLAYAHDYAPLAKKRMTGVQLEAFA